MNMASFAWELKCMAATQKVISNVSQLHCHFSFSRIMRFSLLSFTDGYIFQRRVLLDSSLVYACPYIIAWINNVHFLKKLSNIFNLSVVLSSRWV